MGGGGGEGGGAGLPRIDMSDLQLVLETLYGVSFASKQSNDDDSQQFVFVQS